MTIFGDQLLTITERLPVEITSEILILCAPSMSRTMMLHHREDVDRDFQRDISIPLRLSSVCRLWRNIAHSTPVLWTSFRIYISSRDFPEPLQQAQQWLSRSGQLPLSIQICSDPSASINSLDPLVYELIDLVNSCSHRWASLDLSAHQYLLPFFSKSTTTLKAVTVLSSGYFGPFCDWLLGIHWNNITHFTACYIHDGQALEILRVFPQLQECSFITFRGGDDDFSPPSSPHHLIHLETLLVDIEEPMLDNLLNNISVPSLKNFNYDGSDYSLSCDSIFTFLNRSGCLLNTFSLKHANITKEEIINLLFAMPYLETLILGPPTTDSLQCAIYNFGIPWVTDRMLDLLADTAEISTSLDDQDEPFLPNLRSFNYTGCVTFSWECIPFIFGERRVKESGASESNQRPFHSLTMELYSRNSDPDLDPNVMLELKRLRTEEGYKVQILDVTDDVHRDLLQGECI